MDIERYLQHPGFGALQPYIDLESGLSSPELIAILAISTGALPHELKHLPGLKHPGRRARVVRGLLQSGKLQKRGGVIGTPPAPSAAPQPKLRKALQKSIKLRKALDLLLDPLALLRLSGLATLVDELGLELGLGLQRAIRRANASKARDRAIRQRKRVSTLAFVGRNVPGNLVRMTPRGPAPPYAPGDILQRTISSVTLELSPKDAIEREREIMRLYHHAAATGETLLSHWWRILEALWSAGLEGEQLWLEWRRRLESYVLRRRRPFPMDLQLAGIEARALKARYPVPDIGYGPWVEDEIRLRSLFWGRYQLAAGELTHDLWVRAHESLASGRGPSYVGAYEDRLFQAADSLGNFEHGVLEDIRAGRRTRRMKESGRHANRYVRGMDERSAILKAVRRVSKHARPNTTQGGHVAWARRLLTLAARKEAGQKFDAAEYNRLIKYARTDGNHGGSRKRARTLAERALRGLHDMLEWHPIQVAPDCRFYADQIVERVGQVCDFIASEPEATQAQRVEAAAAVFEYIRRRAFVHVIHDNGVVEQHTLIMAARMNRQEHEAERVFRTLSARIAEIGHELSAAA